MNSIISSLIVILVFAIIGWRLFRSTRPPKKWWAWVLIILGTIVAGTIGVSTIVVGVTGFEIRLNDLLQGLGVGAIARFILIAGKTNKLVSKEA